MAGLNFRGAYGFDPDDYNGNGGRPHPSEPLEWGPGDEESFRNYGR